MDRFVIRKKNNNSGGEEHPKPSARSGNSDSSHVEIGTTEDTSQNKGKRDEKVYSQPPDDLGDTSPRQPKLTKFPTDEDGRKFQTDWYKRYEWLEYSIERQSAFCFACRKHGTGSAEHLKKFTVQGFNKWRQALGDPKKGLVQHETSTIHSNAMMAWRQKNVRLETNKTVSMMVSHDVLENRKYYLKSIAEIVQFLASNELAFRGTYDKSEQEEHGLFMNLFKYTVKKDSKLAKIENEIPKNATLRSPVAQNDAINLMATMVSEKIAEEVQNSDAGKFTLLGDGTRNKSRVENISCAVRYVKDGKPEEHLLVIKSTEKLDANSLTDVLLAALAEWKLDPTNIVSQCYDGASCMSGEHGGVQKILQNRLNKTIPYVHCKNHRLHLVVVDLVSGIDSLSVFFDRLGVLYNFFSQFKVDKVYDGTSLKRVIATRWSGHYDSTVAVVKNYSEILAAVDLVSKSHGEFDAEDVAIATGLSKILREESFKFCAVLMKKVLGILQPADGSLQDRETDINESINLINTSVKMLQELRSDKSYTELMEQMNNLSEEESAGMPNEIESMDTDEKRTEEPANNHNLAQAAELSRPKRKRTVTKRLTDYYVTEPLQQTMGEAANADVADVPDWKKPLMFEVIDKVLVEMKVRFTDSSWLYTSVRALSRNSDKFLDRETLLPLNRNLNIDIPSAAELEVAKNYLQDHVEVQKHQDSNYVLKELYQQRKAFPMVYKLAATVASFGSSSAVCESGFSVLSRVDRPTRRSMLQQRQANLVLLGFEKGFTGEIDMDTFVKRFSALHPRLMME